jgi:hypothetical protein
MLTARPLRRIHFPLLCALSLPLTASLAGGPPPAPAVAIDLQREFAASLHSGSLAGFAPDSTPAFQSMDAAYRPWESEKHFALAAGEVALLEFIPWALARWVRHWEDPADNWAKISTASVWRNISEAWTYDGDNFLTNIWAHPYHGNLFFNAGRANGYSFWESVPFALTGSMLWEYFGETFRPAFNDWINTGVTGSNLGEVAFRMSTMITDNTASGSDRLWREVAGTLVNPVRGFNRLISGEMSRTFPNPADRMPSTFRPLLVVGARGVDTDNRRDFRDPARSMIVELGVNYGNLFEADLRKPFSSFDFGLGLSLFSKDEDSAAVISRIYSRGLLRGWKLKTEGDVRSLIALSLVYDYINNPAFEFGQTSLAAGWYALYPLGESLDLATTAGLRGILMGATPNDYYKDVEGRTYDFGPGTGVSLAASLRSGGWDILRLLYDGGWIWTMSLTDGLPVDSKHNFHFLVLEGIYPFSRSLGVGIGLGAFWRESYYAGYKADVMGTNSIGRIFIAYVPWEQWAH